MMSQLTSNRSLAFDLATAAFIGRHEDALFLGPPGTGKSHLAWAIGLAAILQGYRVRYRETHALLDDTAEAAIEAYEAKLGLAKPKLSWPYAAARGFRYRMRCLVTIGSGLVTPTRLCRGTNQAAVVPGAARSISPRPMPMSPRIKQRTVTPRRPTGIHVCDV